MTTYLEYESIYIYCFNIMLIFMFVIKLKKKERIIQDIMFFLQYTPQHHKFLILI